ncbi:rac GTPase-activating protein 1-like isoform X2 [Copidosoma floridanum]|uniref:rac GTPase-activating protein 1-like isoform X2 n=1 Tax=Copidosoma floridanum TaxID=29053 RepID=UPI0006C955D5|nr:rac GTPase-activating protein 1-like isoform X2 [Copidosoma floridanum]
MSTTSLSLLASYDELVRCTNVLINGSCEGEFLQFAINQEEIRQKWLASVQECQRLHSALEKAHHEAANLDRKLNHARRLLDEEKKKRRHAEDQRHVLERQITLVKDLLLTDGGRNLNDETREKLQFLNNTTLNGRHSSSHMRDHLHDKLNTITEMDSTGSILSDLSCFSKSEDDLDTSIIIQQNTKKREWREHRPSGEYITNKKRRSALQKTVDLNSSDRIIATTTVVVPKDGAITASSVIEAVPGDENQDPKPNSLSNENSRRKRKSVSVERRSKSKSLILDQEIHPTPSAPKKDIISSNSDTENNFKPSPNIGGYVMNAKTTMRGHSFREKPVMIPNILCTPCGKRIRFGKAAVKCIDCRAVCHYKCKELVPLPCVPTGNTPTLRGVSGTIADYTPRSSPMVPSLVVHCINEIELRGRGAPNLSDVDIPTICSTLKDFLRTLKEPLITIGLRDDFARAANMEDKVDSEAALYQAISELPQPNRDTLAFLILHLQRVSSTPECKMPITNLAKIFGPTLVGYSSVNPSRMSILNDTVEQVAVVQCLLNLPSDYWANFVNQDHLNDVPLSTPKTSSLRHTPSTDSLTTLKRTDSRGFFQTPMSTSKLFRKNKRYFGTPPSKQVH